MKRKKKKQVKRKSKAGVKQIRLSNRELRELAMQKMGVIEVCVVSGREVETAEWVRLKCQFGCDCYGTSLVCPPFTPSGEQMRKVLDEYRRAILIHCEPEADVKATVAELERDIFLRGAWKALGLGAGPCYLCRTCPVEKKQCRYPEEARPSMEACGIDVFSTVRKFGFPIEVVRTRRQCPNYYGLILID